MTGKKKKKRKKDEKLDIADVATKEVDLETLQLLEKARQKLEAKSRIYDKMQSGEMEDVENIHGETKFLVDFEKKYYSEENSEKAADSSGNPESQSTSIFEANESHREKMRTKWEKEQQEILDGPVHYEHVKFDEVRELGTSYFAFSKDHEERKKQMDEFQKMREHTKNVQNKKELLREKRKAALQDRLDKVKLRKYGNVQSETGDSSSDGKLDVIDSDHKSVHDNSDDFNNTRDQSDSSTLSSRDEDLLKQCRKDSEKEREWDLGKKSGLMKQPFVKSKNTLLSYEEIVEKRRDDRDETFAPPTCY